jgi:short-subunit dehydrogenase
MNIEGKTALLTGANGGIGQALVAALKKEKVNCILVEKEAHRSDDSVFGCDLSEPLEIKKLADRLRLKLDTIDFLFNIAGIGIYKKIEDLDLDEWNLSIALNLTAPFYLTKELMPLLKNSKTPFIFNIGSAMGVTPTPERTAYCASKFGLRGLSLTLSQELKSEGISVSLLTLGSVMTNFGTGGISRRTHLASHGKEYLTPEIVADFIISILKSDGKKDEYALYP